MSKTVEELMKSYEEANAAVMKAMDTLGEAKTRKSDIAEELNALTQGKVFSYDGQKYKAMQQRGRSAYVRSATAKEGASTEDSQQA